MATLGRTALKTDLWVGSEALQGMHLQASNEVKQDKGSGKRAGTMARRRPGKQQSTPSHAVGGLQVRPHSPPHTASIPTIISYAYLFNLL